MRVLTLVRDMANAHGEAVNLLELLEALDRRGYVLDVAWQRSHWIASTAPGVSRVRHVADKMFRVGHTDHTSDWDPPRVLARFLGSLPGKARLAAGLAIDVARTVPSVATTVARTAWRRPDVVLEVRQAGTLWSGAVARLTRAALVCQVNVIIDARPKLDRALLAPADRVVAVSRFVADELVRLGIVPVERVRVVHNGVDPDAYPFADAEERTRRIRELGLEPEDRVVLCYGRLNPVKGVETLLAAALQAPRAYRLVIVGRYTDPSYHVVLEPLFNALAEAGRPALRVEHQEDVVPYLHAADVVVLPSIREEAFGRVLIEAMSTGRPVVGSRIGGIPEVLEDGFDSQLVTPGDPADLARAIDSLLDWRANDPTLGVRSRARVEERFTLDVATSGMEKVLAEAAAARSRTARRGMPGGRVNRRVHPADR